MGALNLSYVFFIYFIDLIGNLNLKLLEILVFFLKEVKIDKFGGSAVIKSKVQQKTQQTKINYIII